MNLAGESSKPSRLIEPGTVLNAIGSLTFVFTGSLKRWTRSEAKALVESLGGRATTSVSQQTDYLVAGPGAGSKLDEANKHNVQIMDEDRFAEFVEQQRKR